MMRCRNPFPLPDRLDAKLQPVVSLWGNLRRGENGMPFSDDLGVPVLSNLPGNPFLLSVFASPERYRFEFLSENLRQEAVLECFLDETPPNINFSYLRAQSSATVEAAESTLFHLTNSSGYHFSRVLLPLWGNGQINLLMGAFDNVQISCS
ncbi:MAG: hypothetical protein KGL35_29850 [Bradyrhizobium sp.]|uniref:hypothetical protein n=1 Tax=Bradyrhizobium sp. TaxID=376 RepID=UPI001C2A0DF9|nr:hypothetical protein [Bradyrhizobium sp.]MBU6461372.1 hypothetical protein [Pseudomonadota bacterium]MDE2066548.1 hypothetical protein [Bradyrhizobium sp.]MDE2472810.1 hypothetical protein [Bradyrhizobium sp.]